MKEKEQVCSFCGKPKEKTKQLVTGPNGLFICEECVEICKQEIAEGKARMAKAGEFKLKKPAEIKAQLDEYIVGQDKAKKILSVAV